MNQLQRTRVRGPLDSEGLKHSLTFHMGSRDGRDLSRPIAASPSHPVLSSSVGSVAGGTKKKKKQNTNKAGK